MTKAPLDDTARWGRGWQKTRDWEAHSVGRAEADRIAAGYIRLLGKLNPAGKVAGKRGLGIGSGAGHLEAALAAHGFDMVASEWNEDGVCLLQLQNPDLKHRAVDLTSFDDTDAWDLIVCRELYPFTRTNAFSQQIEIVSRLLDALRPGGVLLIVGSDVSSPHCLDYQLLLREVRSDPRVAQAIGPVLESLLKRMRWNPVSIVGYRLANALAELVLQAINCLRKPRIAGIRAYAIRKAS